MKPHNYDTLIRKKWSDSVSELQKKRPDPDTNEDLIKKQNYNIHTHSQMTGPSQIRYFETLPSRTTIL